MFESIDIGLRFELFVHIDDQHIVLPELGAVDGHGTVFGCESDREIHGALHHHLHERYQFASVRWCFGCAVGVRGVPHLPDSLDPEEIENIMIQISIKFRQILILLLQGRVPDFLEFQFLHDVEGGVGVPGHRVWVFELSAELIHHQGHLLR